jgi:hypothetical protein
LRYSPLLRDVMGFIVEVVGRRFLVAHPGGGTVM